MRTSARAFAAVCALLAVLMALVGPSVASANPYCQECVTRYRVITLPDGSFLIFRFDECKTKNTVGIAFDDYYIDSQGYCHPIGAQCVVVLV